MTITEISNLGKPSILIPLPNVSNNHQMHNAKVLENIRAAKIIENDKLNGDVLSKAIEEIILNKDVLKQMGENSSKIAVKDTNNKIYNEIKKLVNK